MTAVLVGYEAEYMWSNSASRYGANIWGNEECCRAPGTARVVLLSACEWTFETAEMVGCKIELF